jgi:hypothetical protein
MSYYCKYCGSRHANAETGRECYRLHREKMAKQAQDPPASGKLRPPVEQLRSGHYALTVAGETVPALLEVVVPDRGRWSGFAFLNLYDGSHKEAVTSSADRQFIAQQLTEKGLRACMVAYGKLTGYCPVCNGRLASDEEAMAGYHTNPVVAGAPCYMTLNQR